MTDETPTPKKRGRPPKPKPVVEVLPPQPFNSPAWALRPELPYFVPHQADRFCKPKELKPMEVVHALVEARGNVAYAARLLTRSRIAVQRFIENHEICQKTLDGLRETLLDDAEHNFVRAVEAGHLEASKFVLQSFGKSRGYFRPGVTAEAKDAAGNKVTFTIEA